MTKEEAITLLKKLRTFHNGTYAKAIDMAIKALSTERPTGSDFISKAKVLETYSELYWFDSDCGVVSKAEVDKIYERLQSLPSADRPTGEWIKSNLLPNGWNCDNCGSPIMTDDISEMLFCPNCGAYKGGESDG